MLIDREVQEFDDQELQERNEAAMALGEENPDLFVDYAHDMITLSEQSTRETRKKWDDLLNGYRGKIDYSRKEPWQAKVVTGDLNSTVKQAVAVIRKAFRQPGWYSVDGVGPEDAHTAAFLREAFGVWLNAEHARFSTTFCDAIELGFAIGQTHEVIPMWLPGRGLIFTMVPPWQIYRDPDAVPRDPWSGDFWIHVEWLDLWKIKKLGENKNYVRLDEVTANEAGWGIENQDRKARRKNQYYQRSTSRHACKMTEFWGVILDKQGELLLENARFTIAGDILIRNPEPNPFVTLRWPGVSFSPMPDFFSFEGHGIIETVFMMWIMTCNLMSLHIDDISWRVNRMYEVNRMDLEDPTDLIFSPGKLILKSKDAPPRTPAVREIYTQPTTNEVLATLQHWDQRRENTAFVNQFVAGQRGTRTQITKGEVELKTSQSMTIFDSMGQDIEEGAINILRATKEIMVLNWSEHSYPSVSRVLPNSEHAKLFAMMSYEAKKELLQANCDIKISGISNEIKNSDLVPRIQFMMQQASLETFGKYIKSYPLLKQAATVLGFYDPDFICTGEEAKAVDVYWEQIRMISEKLARETEGGRLPEVRGGNGEDMGSEPAAVNEMPGLPGMPEMIGGPLK